MNRDEREEKTRNVAFFRRIANRYREQAEEVLDAAGEPTRAVDELVRYADKADDDADRVELALFVDDRGLEAVEPKLAAYLKRLEERIAALEDERDGRNGR